MCQDALLAFKVVSLMAISITQLGKVKRCVGTNIQSFMLLHHYFIYAKLEELYLVTSNSEKGSIQKH